MRRRYPASTRYNRLPFIRCEPAAIEVSSGVGRLLGRRNATALTATFAALVGAVRPVILVILARPQLLTLLNSFTLAAPSQFRLLGVRHRSHLLVVLRCSGPPVPADRGVSETLLLGAAAQRSPHLLQVVEARSPGSAESLSTTRSGAADCRAWAHSASAVARFVTRPTTQAGRSRSRRRRPYCPAS